MDRRLLRPARAEIAEIFNVPLGAANGRVRQAKDGKVDFPLRARRKCSQHLQMHRGIAHDALFADLFPSCLELGLDQADGVAALPAEAPTSAGQNQLERDKRHVHRRRNPARPGSAPASDSARSCAPYTPRARRCGASSRADRSRRPRRRPFRAPFCSIQSVKPPVEAPMSAQIAVRRASMGNVRHRLFAA